MNQLQLVQQLSELLPDVWSTVSETVSASAGLTVKFESPLAMRAAPQDLLSELGGNMLCIQFAMASQPADNQVILIKTETLLEIARVTTGMSWEDIDDNALAELRPFAESIVQGICLGLGNVMLETVVATGMSIRYQQLSLPENINASSSIVRTQVAFNLGETSGVVLWLMDDETASIISGLDKEEDNVQSNNGIQDMGMFPNAAPGVPGVKGGREMDPSMEVLMDVPLEISVELGRVKMIVREVLDLGTGSIVEVDKAAGEPVDVMVNGRLIAKGEVVVIEDNFGVRITEILNPVERFRADRAA
jgi:flagellar motor switch protein FliN